VKHVGHIAGRELRSLFVSPVAYVVLTLWAVLAGFFFLSAVSSFGLELMRMQQFGAFDQLREMNLNDHVFVPFLGSMWIVLVFAIPGVSMGLLAAEKANGTEELLLTTPLSIWEIVLGKYLAGACFALLMVLVVACFAGLLFVYGDPEVGKTAAGLLGLLLVSLAYMAVGVLASSLTSNFLVAFFVSFGSLLTLLLLPFIAQLASAGQTLGASQYLADILSWLGTGGHFEQLAKGWIDTSDLFYFVAFIAACLILAKTAVESVRWR
jgi:ABC-2 type transport system permease protein